MLPDHRTRPRSSRRTTWRCVAIMSPNLILLRTNNWSLEKLTTKKKTKGSPEALVKIRSQTIHTGPGSTTNPLMGTFRRQNPSRNEKMRNVSIRKPFPFKTALEASLESLKIMALLLEDSSMLPHHLWTCLRMGLSIPTQTSDLAIPLPLSEEGLEWEEDTQEDVETSEEDLVRGSIVAGVPGDLVLVEEDRLEVAVVGGDA